MTPAEQYMAETSRFYEEVDRILLEAAAKEKVEREARRPWWKQTLRWACYKFYHFLES